MKKLLFFIPLFFISIHGILFAATKYPDYTGYVNDFAHVFSSGFVSQLNTKLLEFEKKTTDQIAVVTVDTTSPETIEEYSIHLADKWKVGQKGKDNGVIMLFAMKDRKMRIEVGRGLEGDLTDIQARHIETDIISPAFKLGQYENGVDKGVSVVIATITHDTSTAAKLGSAPPATQNVSGWAILIILIVVIVILIFIAISPSTRLGGRGVWGPTVFWGEGKSGDDSGGGGFGGFGGGGFSGGGSTSSW